MSPPTSPPTTRWQPVAAALLVALLALAWTLPITTRMIGEGDFPDHLQLAEAVAAEPHVPAPHFLFFASVALVMRLLAIPSAEAGIVVVSLVHAGTACLVWAYLRRQAPSSPVAPVVATLALLMAGPILPPFVEPTTYLIGYSPPNAYHNATFIVSKPFCLWLLLVAAGIFGPAPGRFAALRAAAAVVLNGVSKPNYLLCVVPAAAVAAWWRLPRVRRNVVALAVLGGTAVVLTLAMQRAYAESGVRVIVAPFLALSFHTAIGPALAAQLLASLAFPLVVLAAWPRAAGARHDATLAWGAALAALGQAYLLAESGSRVDHGNLLVAGPQSVFVLLVISAGTLLALPAAESTARRGARALAWGVLALHVAGGLRHVAVRVETGTLGERPLTIVAAMALAAFVLATGRRRQPAPAAPVTSAG